MLILSFASCVDPNQNRHQAQKDFKKYVGLVNSYMVEKDSFKDNQGFLSLNVSEEVKQRLSKTLPFVSVDSFDALFNPGTRGYVYYELYDLYKSDSNYLYCIKENDSDFYAYQIIAIHKRENKVLFFENFPELPPGIPKPW